MTANPILLQKKYSRVIESFAKQHGYIQGNTRFKPQIA